METCYEMPPLSPYEDEW